MESDNQRLDIDLEKAPHAGMPWVPEQDRQMATKLYPQVEWTEEKLEMAKALGHL